MTNKKLALVADIAADLEKEGVTLTPNAVRARLRVAMLRLAQESCRAMGAEVEEEELERIAGSRAFQEAVASLLVEEDAP
jgi:hypothetical protein